MEHMYLTFEATNGTKTVWDITEKINREELFDLVRLFNDNKSHNARIVAHCCSGESLAYEFNVSNVEDIYSMVDVWDAVDMERVRSVLTGATLLELTPLDEDSD